MTELRVTIPDEVAERLASEAAERGTSAEDLAADLLRQHVPATRRRSLGFIAIGEALPGAPSVAEAERQLEDGEDPGYPP
jgi:plasmid stability protein